MSAKNMLDKNKKLALKEELEALLNMDDSLNPNNSANKESDNNQGDLKSVIQGIADKTEQAIDFEEMETRFKKKSTELMDSLFNFYIDLGVITDTDYFKYKKRLDQESINDIEFQLETIKICIKKGMEEVTTGNVHPRMLEVIANMQGQLTNVIKTKANYLLFLEDSYKKLKMDAQERTNTHSDYLPSSNEIKQIDPNNITEIKKDEYYVGVGTRNLIKQINEDISMDQIKESNKDKETYNLTNPNGKSQLMKNLNVTDEMIRTNDKEENNQNDIDSSDIENII